MRPEPVQVRSASPRVSPLTIVALIAAGALLAALAAAMSMRRSQLDQASAIRFTEAPPSAQALRLNQFATVIAFSPDGRHFVYAARAGDENVESGGTGGALMLRSLDRLEATMLVASGRSPFFSPSGDWVEYFDDNEFVVKKVPISGGSPVAICRFVGGPRRRELERRQYDGLRHSSRRDGAVAGSFLSLDSAGRSRGVVHDRGSRPARRRDGRGARPRER